MAVKGAFDLRRGLLTAADLSAHQFKVVELSSGNIRVPPAASGDGGEAIGVLQGKPESGFTGEVILFGYSKVIAGEAISIGDYLIAEGSDTAAEAGRVLAATMNGDETAADEVIIGRALSAASAANEVIEAFVWPVMGNQTNRTYTP